MATERPQRGSIPAPAASPATEQPTDLMCLKDAAKLIPSPHGGNRGVHVNTVKRWILTGRLRHWRIGAYILVSRADVLAVPKQAPAPKPVPEPVPEGTYRPETEAILRKHGLLRD
jgi:excisionase family DNA binding protein